MNNLQVIEHNGERVLTTEQLARVYGCEPSHITKNFNNNKEHFEEGKHFYKLTGDVLKDFKSYIQNLDLPLNKFAPQLYLWTRRGASRHSKMLGTDKAWEMFDALEENYFNPRPKQLTPAEQMAQGLLAAQKLLADKEQRIQFLESETERMRPMEVFANATAASDTSILVGELAKLIKQNGVDMGQNRLFKWMRENGYLIKSGAQRNMPTQKSMNLGLFEIKERNVANPDGSVMIVRTPKVTGKGQIYFVNLFLKNKGQTGH